MTTSDPLVWIDCEMTGLDLSADALIEVAVIVTDYELRPLGAGLDLLITPPASALEQMDDFVRSMHTASGLLAELEGGMSLPQAQDRIMEHVTSLVPEPRTAQLAGNSVGTDKAFLALLPLHPLPGRGGPHLRGVQGGRGGDHRLPHRSHPGTVGPARASAGAAGVVTPGHAGPGSAEAWRRRGMAAHGATAQRDAVHGAQVGFVADVPIKYRPVAMPSHDGGCSSVGRAPGCGPGGRGFNPRRSPRVKGSLRFLS